MTHVGQLAMDAIAAGAGLVAEMQRVVRLAQLRHQLADRLARVRDLAQIAHLAACAVVMVVGRRSGWPVVPPLDLVQSRHEALNGVAHQREDERHVVGQDRRYPLYLPTVDALVMLQ